MKQTENLKTSSDKRLDIILKGPRVIVSNALKEDSLIYVRGELWIEGIDNDYSLNPPELELHSSFSTGNSLTILNI